MPKEESLTVRFDKCKKDNQEKTKMIRTLENAIDCAKAKEIYMHKRHTKIVSKLHSCINDYRKKLIDCLQFSIPNVEEDYDLG